MGKGTGDLQEMDEQRILQKVRIKRFAYGEVTLAIEPYMINWLADLKDMDLTVQFKRFREKRSLLQNNKLWALIGAIDLAENGRNSADGEMAIYMNLIKMANVKTEIYMMNRSALEETAKRQVFRFIEVLEQHDDMVVCRCYYGSSNFTTKEMADFIEATLDYAMELGIDLQDYKELTK